MNGKLYTAYPIEEGTVARIADKFAEHLGTPVQLTQVVDNTLVGGFVVQLGFLRFDHSAKAALKEMMLHMQTNA